MQRKPASKTKSEPQPIPFELSEEDRNNLINEHLLKPSSLPKSTNSPLLFLSPAELAKLSAQQDQEAEAEEIELELWEELANAVLFTIPFGFLFAGL